MFTFFLPSWNRNDIDTLYEVRIRKEGLWVTGFAAF